MNNTISTIIIECLMELNEELQLPELANPTLSTPIFGHDGLLDSLSLVSLIADIEYSISTKLQKNIILADEKAMSQNNSPFRSIQTLTDYIHLQL